MWGDWIGLFVAILALLAQAIVEQADMTMGIDQARHETGALGIQSLVEGWLQGGREFAGPDSGDPVVLDHQVALLDRWSGLGQEMSMDDGSAHSGSFLW